MIEYKGQLNMGNEALGADKTITANEQVRTCDTKALAREISHQNSLIPEDVAASVLGYFCKAAVQKMAEGFAVQLTNGNDVALRIFPDVHVKGGNINLARAKELDPTVTELTEENAGALIDKAGVIVRVRAICQQKFTDLLDAEEYQLKRTGVEVVPYVAKGNGNNENENENENQGGNGGGNGGNGGNTGGGDEG
jgi:hypothetical protein